MMISDKISRSSGVKAAVILVGALALSGCGNTAAERGVSGGGIGAGVGAAGAAIAGGSALTGAVVGGAAGAAVGVLTDQDDIDLGEFPN